MANQKPILELSTLAPERTKIAIDGELYEIALATDFGLLDGYRIEQLQEPMRAYSKPGPRTEEIVAKMSEALEDFVGLVLKAPADVIAKLTESQMLQIVGVFTTASGIQTDPPPTPRRARRRTTGKSSRGSNGSSEATPSDGL